MRFIQIINHKRFVLVSLFLFFYIILNLLDGERGLISYYEKQKIKKLLIKEKNAEIAGKQKNHTDMIYFSPICNSVFKKR